MYDPRTNGARQSGAGGRVPSPRPFGRRSSTVFFFFWRNAILRGKGGHWLVLPRFFFSSPIHLSYLPNVGGFARSPAIAAVLPSAPCGLSTPLKFPEPFHEFGRIVLLLVIDGLLRVGLARPSQSVGGPGKVVSGFAAFPHAQITRHSGEGLRRAHSLPWRGALPPAYLTRQRGAGLSSQMLSGSRSF